MIILVAIAVLLGVAVLVLPALPRHKLCHSYRRQRRHESDT